MEAPQSGLCRFVLANIYWGGQNVHLKEWTARSTNDAVVIEKDALVKVIAVEGVKLMVEPYER